MKKIDRIVAIVTFLFSVLVLIIIPKEITAVGSTSVGMTARTYPSFAAWALLLCSIGLFVSSFISHTEEGTAPQFVIAEELKVFLVLLIIFFYALACEYLGFYLSTILTGSIFMLLFKDKVWYHHVIYIVFTTVSFLLFTKVLYIHLPKLGIWFF